MDVDDAAGEFATVQPNRVSVSVADIDWLVASDPDFERSPLAVWDGLHDSSALSSFARLRRAHPEYLEKATRYLFRAATTGFDQTETFMGQEEVDQRSVDRRACMLGGFPWTDDANPWPKHEQEDGQVTWAEPIVQLNLETLSRQLGVKLPPVLLQFWDGVGLIEIPLSNTSHDDASATGGPDWFMPQRGDEPPVGWTRSDDGVVGSYLGVGAAGLRLPRMEAFLDNNTTYYDEYVFQGEDEWKDLYEWADFRPVPEAIQEELGVLEEAAWEAFTASRAVPASFLGVPMRSEISYEDWVKDGYRLLYIVSGARMSIWGDGFVAIFYRSTNGTFEFATQVGS